MRRTGPKTAPEAGKSDGMPPKTRHRSFRAAISVLPTAVAAHSIATKRNANVAPHGGVRSSAFRQTSLTLSRKTWVTVGWEQEIDLRGGLKGGGLAPSLSWIEQRGGRGGGQPPRPFSGWACDR